VPNTRKSVPFCCAVFRRLTAHRNAIADERLPGFLHRPLTAICLAKVSQRTIYVCIKQLIRRIGNSSEFCGGPNRLNVYNFTGVLPHPPGGGGGGGPVKVSPVKSGLPSPWTYASCYMLVIANTSGDLLTLGPESDNAHGRVLEYQNPDDDALTVENCISTCLKANFTLAGVEYATQCCTLTYTFFNLLSNIQHLSYSLW
jgi:hypothetical protein